MGKAAIFVSDLHLGRGDDLEDFSKTNESAFVQFLATQSEKHRGNEVDLVLLGDSFDIWQIATDEDKSAARSGDIDIQIRVDREQERMQQIISAHPRTFSALAQFLSADSGRRRVFFTTGNHDHSLIHAGLQEAVKDAVAGSKAALRDGIIFSNYYDSPDLRTYGEHGNQCDENCRYEEYGDFGPECPGYYFVRLFWNRLEPKDPDLKSVAWWNIFQYLWSRGGSVLQLFGTVITLWRQYKTDKRPFKRIDVPGVPFFGVPFSEEGEETAAAPVTEKPLPGFPELLLSEIDVPERIFSMDDATENRLRTLYHDAANQDFRKAVDQILADKYQILKDKYKYDVGPPPVPSEAVEPVPGFGILQDEYKTAVGEMFAPAGQPPRTYPMKRSALTAGNYDYVLLGHTHVENFDTLEHVNATYINTGSWAAKRDLDGRDISRLCYTTIFKKPDGSISATQDCWKAAS